MASDRSFWYDLNRLVMISCEECLTASWYPLRTGETSLCKTILVDCNWKLFPLPLVDITEDFTFFSLGNFFFSLKAGKRTVESSNDALWSITMPWPIRVCLACIWRREIREIQVNSLLWNNWNYKTYIMKTFPAKSTCFFPFSLSENQVLVMSTLIKIIYIEEERKKFRVYFYARLD